MPYIKPKLTMDQKVDYLLKQAEEVYLQHFGAQVTAGPALIDEQIDAAIFGYIYAVSFSDSAEVREVAYSAMQKKFGWDDEYIATAVIGG